MQGKVRGVPYSHRQGLKQRKPAAQPGAVYRRMAAKDPPARASQSLNFRNQQASSALLNAASASRIQSGVKYSTGPAAAKPKYSYNSSKYRTSDGY